MGNTKILTPDELSEKLKDEESSFIFVIDGSRIMVKRNGTVEVQKEFDADGSYGPGIFILNNGWFISSQSLIAEYIKLHEAYENNSK